MNPGSPFVSSFHSAGAVVWIVDQNGAAEAIQSLPVTPMPAAHVSAVASVYTSERTLPVA